MDQLRTPCKDVSLDLLGQLVGGNVSEPDASLMGEADAESIRQAIMTLAPDQQAVIFLRFYKELPYEAVAARLGKSTGAIRQIQSRALTRLRREMKHRPGAAVG